MSSPERPPIPKKRVSSPLSIGMVSAAMAITPANIDINPPLLCPTQPITDKTITLQLDQSQTEKNSCKLVVRNPDQEIMISGYGHREKDEIMRYGNIADGFRPVNGIEYGEEDLKLAFEILQLLKDSHIDGVVWSWHSEDDGKPDSRHKDWRDNFIHWWPYVMNHPDNPNPLAIFSLMFEADSNHGSLPPEIIRKNFIHLKDVFEHKNFWKNENGESVIMIYGNENEALSGNFNFFSNWGEPSKEFNIEPIFQDFIGSEFFNPEFIGNDITPFISSFEGNNFFDQEKYKTFSYGFPILDLRPDGLDLRPVNRVTIAYKKLKPTEGQMPGDLKEIPFDSKALEDRMITAINTGRDILINSLNEEVENSSLRGRSKAQKAISRVTPTFSEANIQSMTLFSGDQYINFIQQEIDNKPIFIPPANLPPAAPREIPLPVLEARKRREEELIKPNLKPVFKPLSRDA